MVFKDGCSLEALCVGKCQLECSVVHADSDTTRIGGFEPESLNNMDGPSWSLNSEHTFKIYQGI